MVNMYFNGKSFVYCRKQEEKFIKLTYRGSIYMKYNLLFFLNEFRNLLEFFELSIYWYVIRKTYFRDIFYLFKNSYIRIFSNEKLILK